MKQIFMYMWVSMGMMIVVILLILLAVAFLTLMERKVLSYMQLRKGPNKVGYIGIFQPFSDAIKLLSKEMIMLKQFNYLYYMLSPMFMLMLILMMWMVYPFLSNMISLELGFMYLIFCLSLGGYGLLISGWSSNSSYSMLGSIRALSQSISYEVSLSLIFMILIILVESFNMIMLNIIQKNMWFIIFMFPLMLMMFISMMAEMNRTPFDFSEGESELVSGFNVEYMSGGFVLIFLSEHASILFMSFILSLMFTGLSLGSFMFYLFTMILIFMIIWMRGTFPRFRYDLLMYLCWLIILPFILNYMFFIILIKMMV